MQKKNIINVISPGTKTGKTTIALNTAAILSSKKYKTCILDLTLNKSATNYFFPVSGPGTSIITWLDIEKCEYAVENLPRKGLEDIYIVSAPALREQAELITPELIQHVVYCLINYFDYLVIDTGIEFKEEVLKLSGIYKTIIVSTPEKHLLEKLEQYSGFNNINPQVVVNKATKKNLNLIFSLKPSNHKIICIGNNKNAIESAIYRRPRTFPIHTSKNVKKQITKIINFNYSYKGKGEGVADMTKKLKMNKKNKKPKIEVHNSVHHVLTSAKKSPKPLVVLDANFKKPSLSIAFNVPPSDVWQHDWRTGGSVKPYKVDKGIDLYILDPNIKDFDDRDGDLLVDYLYNMYKEYKIIIILGEHEMIAPYLHSVEKAIDRSG